jgi:hypothetical protein
MEFRLSAGGWRWKRCRGGISLYGDIDDEI